MSVRSLVCVHACVHMCLDTGIGCDGWRSRWPLLVCDVHGHGSESPAQVWARISSHLHHGQEGGGWGVMKDATLGLRTAGRQAPSRLSSQVGTVSSSSPSSSPAPPPLISLLSPQVLSPGLAPSQKERSDPDPGRRQILPAPLPWS